MQRTTETRSQLSARGAPRERRPDRATNTDGTEILPLSPRATAGFRAAALFLAPATTLISHGYHPWIGNPGDPEFLARLAAAVAADPTRWALAHLGVAVGSAFFVLAFLALRGYLSEAGEDRWSAIGLPFVVVGSVLYALLPAMEFAPFAAYRAGADAAAVQAALLPWFVPILLIGAAIFAFGVAAFAVAMVRSRAMERSLTFWVVGALVVVAATRFAPVGAAQLYVGPVAGMLALWPLAYRIGREGMQR